MSKQEILLPDSLVARAVALRKSVPTPMLWGIGIAVALLTLSELMRLGAFARIDSFLERHVIIAAILIVDMLWTLRVGRR